ncbi:asparagine synthase (glutamine-hydrolysing) [Pseudomonas sp. NFPP10]|uniref:asparagine synthase (glutamine-hydrolyzing) n=1 Tax=Pseudomonas TaxID=286 RepID=UPI0008914372|nr:MULTISPECIES: asparagine synthase (glutamine-hydrolyzing) [Pseudomonas]MBP5100072.1 asparagine synthase (glutamine-hydrolyzing) [Pseudomonas protegens]MBP5116473.1 asparagine synthase (glutamine-hydrolyzing) [Pseudomonas protegens]MBP5126606.1 asparagine synthase (glutamine-hydrolyzing) [Pseudomonas protegens]POA90836.1 asparagine synthase (glutamine-hydrolyzing) [Pseudomonas protegens]PZP07975.1 MAG: asparagine synthase (glutamine-hydrolyzing) [Pseudomonas protegens]
MCGITGLIHLDNNPVSPAVLQRMTDAIAHRGPDGEGHWIEGNVGLGHRRLAIIDLSPAGHQPAASLSQRYVLVYNGEVYNFRELRTELETLGYQFRSRTDTEVVLNALIAWGAQALERFNGMFGLALWDRQEQTLLLARDRYGIKPLYYAQQGQTLAFGSEQKAILAMPEFRRSLDKEALLEYFTFQNIFTDKTLLNDVKLLPAGHYAVLDMKRRTPALQLTQYWDYNFQEPKVKASDEEYREELDRLFQQAVNRQLVTDVELGSYLSGGMDSGSITAIAAKSYPYMKTFTCGFDLNSASGIEMGFDERSKAEYMSYHFKTEHYQMVLKAGDMERVLPKLAWHLEEPRVGQSYPNYYAAQLASKFVKVVMSGAGGDELFGGYPWRYYRAVVNDDFEHYIDKYYAFWQRLIPNNEIKQVFAPIWKDVKHVWTRDIFRDVFKHHADNLYTPEDYINHSLYFEAKTFLHGLLVVEDKLSMAHGLESRVPFLDNDLVDFAMRCPVHLKLNNLADVIRINENDQGDKVSKYFEKARDGKQIFRDVMKRYIPDDVARAEKQGFSAPDSSWFKGESMEFVRRKLLNKNAHIYDVFDQSALTSLVEEHLSGKQNRRLLIWSLLNMEEYMQGCFA